MAEPTHYKLVWFVPREALETTRDAVFAAGGGRIGDYTRCSWYTAGTGTFLAGEGADPSIGRGGEGGARLRAARRDGRAGRAGGRRSCARCATRIPYEEVAFELYPLVELGA